MNAIAPDCPSSSDVQQRQAAGQCLESWQTSPAANRLRSSWSRMDVATKRRSISRSRHRRRGDSAACGRSRNECARVARDNRGIAESRAPLIMTWHDDMFLRVPWLVRELLAISSTFRDWSVMSQPRSDVHLVRRAIAEWEDRLTGADCRAPSVAALNWFWLFEVDAVIGRGRYDESASTCRRSRRGVVPTGWDEADWGVRSVKPAGRSRAGTSALARSRISAAPRSRGSSSRAGPAHGRLF